MRTKHVLTLTACMLCMIAAGLVATSGGAQAQPACFCTIGVDAALNCGIDVCYVQPGQPRKCLTVTNALGIGFQCVTGTRFYFRVCGNQYVEVTTANCETNWGVPGCGDCVDACLTQNAAGCYSLRFTKSNSPICKCLPVK